MRGLLTMALLAALVGCDQGDADMDFGDEDLGPDVHSMASTEGEVKMGLTEEFVYFALSEEAVEEARAEMRQETDKEGLEGLIGGVVEKTVGKALAFRAKYPVEAIEDIRWEGGSMVIDFTDRDRRLGDFEVSDQPVTEAFAEEDVREFAEAFRRVKERGGAGG